MTKEEMAVDLIGKGDITVTENGTVLRNGRRIDFIGSDGYCRASLTFQGKTFVIHAHRIVWALANGPIPDGMEVNHKNRVRDDNRLDNLELMTHIQNCQHSGVTVEGTKNSQAILTDADVLEIRRLAGQCTRRELADRFGVHPQMIWLIIKRKNWTHI